MEKEEKFKEKSEEINILERKRKEFDLKWIDLPEEQIASLRLSLQKHVIRLFEIEKEKQKIHEQNKLKYKDLYISILEDKLKERINLLEIQDMKSPANSEGRDQMYTRNFPDDKSNKSKPFSYRLQGEKYLKNKHLKSDSSLPPISPKNQPISHAVSRDSKIPKHKGNQNANSSSKSSATDIRQDRNMSH